MIEAYMPQKEAEKLAPEKMVEALLRWDKSLFDAPPQTDTELFAALRRWVASEDWREFTASLLTADGKGDGWRRDLGQDR